MTAARSIVALWRWDRGEPVPDARLVVCASGFMMGATLAQLGAAAVFARAGGAFVSDAREILGVSTIPALHARTQADLARLPDLLAVQAERRALVLSPKEEIDLSLVLRREVRKHVECSHDDQCPMCTGEICALDGAGGCGWGPHREGYPCEHSVDERHLEVRSGSAIDLVIIIGFDEPLHPEHVRSVVVQCKAAGVPCVFAGWGAWLPQNQSGGPFQPTSYVFLNRDGRIDKTGDGLVTNTGWVGVGRVDGENSGHVVDNRIIRGSGALLDGQPVADIPEWVSA